MSCGHKCWPVHGRQCVGGVQPVSRPRGLRVRVRPKVAYGASDLQPRVHDVGSAVCSRARCLCGAGGTPSRRAQGSTEEVAQPAHQRPAGGVSRGRHIESGRGRDRVIEARGEEAQSHETSERRAGAAAEMIIGSLFNCCDGRRTSIGRGSNRPPSSSGRKPAANEREICRREQREHLRTVLGDAAIGVASMLVLPRCRSPCAAGCSATPSKIAFMSR